MANCRQACRTEIARLGISNNVTLENVRSDAADLLSLFDIYCLPSVYEGLSIALLEAMAMQKAIIASPVNATLDIIAHNIDGMLVAAGTPEDWKNSIVKLHNNPGQRRELGKRARMLVKAHYNIMGTTSKLRELYYNMIPQEREPSKVKPELQSENFMQSV
ncbi:MAG: glycosyltransferase [Owenweeksia sp.]|nr:glycosyltransferase [Owenweeksia sp.]